jgi:hypothetical protein
MTTLVSMPTPPPEATPPTDRADAAPGVLPTLAVPLASDEILDRLGTASRRGRLPGFEGRPPGGALFRVAAFGHPVDAGLDARPHQVNGLVMLDFTLVIPRRLSVILALTLVLTVWPGVYFMDQLMIQIVPSVRAWLPTWWWYLPVSIVPIPWVWRSVMRRARDTTTASAREMIDKIAGELGADIM